jgi:hypothetical protein
MIEMEFELKTGPQGHVYLPKRVRRVFGDRLRFLPSANVAVIYPEDTDPKTVIASLQVIIADLKLRKKDRHNEQK